MFYCGFGLRDCPALRAGLSLSKTPPKFQQQKILFVKAKCLSLKGNVAYTVFKLFRYYKGHI